MRRVLLGGLKTESCGFPATPTPWANYLGQLGPCLWEQPGRCCRLLSGTVPRSRTSSTLPCTAAASHTSHWPQAPVTSFHSGHILTQNLAWRAGGGRGQGQKAVDEKLEGQGPGALQCAVMAPRDAVRGRVHAGDMS